MNDLTKELRTVFYFQKALSSHKVLQIKDILKNIESDKESEDYKKYGEALFSTYS